MDRAMERSLTVAALKEEGGQDARSTFDVADWRNGGELNGIVFLFLFSFAGGMGSSSAAADHRRDADATMSTTGFGAGVGVELRGGWD